jgi:chaperonin GroES
MKAMLQKADLTILASGDATYTIENDRINLLTGNPSGIRPTEFKVLILPKEVEQKTAGGILLPDEHKDRQQFAQQEGTIIAVAPLAFTYASKDEWERVDGHPPKVGDRVSFAKFAGAMMKGKDGKEYRVVNDKDIFAILD